MLLTPCRAQTLDRLVCEAIASLNRNRYPHTFCEWRRVARRAGIRRIQFCPRDLLSSPVLRYDKNRVTAVLYLPVTRCRRRLYVWLLHEVGEFLLGTDMAPPCVYPPQWGDHHVLVKIIEPFHAPPALEPPKGNTYVSLP